ncbi:hypothetical protein CLOP_g16763 [Closterium sp. NIES-67]|nr:hypothetical protein CLOP_g16763 [Closterium sp. NIES-67]
MPDLESDSYSDDGDETSSTVSDSATSREENDEEERFWAEEQVRRDFEDAPRPLQATADQPPVLNVAALRFLHFVREVNGRIGMANADVNRLLQLFMHPEMAQRVLSEYTNVREMEAFELEQLDGLGRGWSTVTFQVEGQPPQTMHLRDASQAFADIYGNPNNAEGFMLRPRIDSDPATGQRQFSTPDTGTWWHDAQAEIGEDAFVGAVNLYSDVTHLSENGRKKAHPLMMTLANVSQTKRWATSGHCLLGTFPIPPRSMPSAQKTELWDRFAVTALEPLFAGMERGFLLKDPNGVERVVKPRLYAWACDYPESGKISGTLSGGTERPCSICYAQKDHLWAVQSPNVTRTVSDQRWIVANHRALSPNPEKTVGSFFSTFPSESVLWKWEIPRAPWSNPYLAIMPDIMHQADLGILHHILAAIRTKLPRELGVFDGRLSYVRDHTRITHLRFPETTYFATGANLAAFKHRAVLQVLVFIVADKLTPDEMEALRLYLEWYLLCCRVPGHTEGSLLQLEGLTLRYFWM